MPSTKDPTPSHPDLSESPRGEMTWNGEVALNGGSYIGGPLVPDPQINKGPQIYPLILYLHDVVYNLCGLHLVKSRKCQNESLKNEGKQLGRIPRRQEQTPF